MYMYMYMYTRGGEGGGFTIPGIPGDYGRRGGGTVHSLVVPHYHLVP